MAGKRKVNAAGDVDINWDDNSIRILLAGESGETTEEIRRRARAVQRRAQSKAPNRTGALRSSISVNTRTPPEGAVAEITADVPYALAVEFGRREVTPTAKKFLNWQGDSGNEVFALSAKAVGATHFLTDALDDAAD